MRSNTGWPRRRGARLAAASAMALAVTATPNARSADREKAHHVDLVYVCSFPSGPQEVGVRIAADVPELGAPNKQIQATQVTTTVSVPNSVRTELSASDATSVSATAQLAMHVTHGAESAEAAWSNLTSVPTPIPAKEDLVLTAKGEVPSVTVESPGDVTFEPGHLTLALHPLKADNSAAVSDMLPIECDLTSGQNTDFATVVVSPVGSANTNVVPGTKDSDPGSEKSARLTAPLDPVGNYPAECHYLDGADPAQSGCSYLTGYNNVKKLGGAALLNAGIMNISGHTGKLCGDRVFCIPVDAELNDRGRQQFPSSASTFLTFGFVPTTAVMEVSEIGLIKIQTVLNFSDLSKSYVTADAQLSIRLHGVKVNGTPLDVGESCKSIEPMNVSLRSSPATYTIPHGGILTGRATIPAFSGCGVGEDLDSLLTASISGPDNDIKMTQGNMCSMLNGDQCPPAKPVPQR
ncbi:DUF6801 domain-containing protein [Streptomyces sp. NPDC005318]|uniref:DUF6801 domain-containing protein n=1 Tax=Streptomyces sp. NPDC005318 TaxID=3157031 RepID=UPI0033A61DD6